MASLYKQDCLEVISTLADQSIDVVLTDPPYFLHKLSSDNWNDEKPTTKSVVSNLPSGMKFDSRQAIQFGEFCEQWISLLLPKLKPGAFLISFAGDRFYHRLVVAAENNNLEIRGMMIWYYGSGQPKAFHVADGRFTPQLRPMFEPIMLAQKPREGTFKQNWENYNIGTLDMNKCDDGLTPGNLLFYCAKPGKEERANNHHPTQKPVELMRHLVKVFSAEGSKIIDPFMGSGTSGVACVESGRAFLGIEKDPEYYQIAKDCIEFAEMTTQRHPMFSLSIHNVMSSRSTNHHQQCNS
jgi:site-specific DNA-methyltransferase (adenine-specific)